jgi:hypothetical protein
MRMQILLDPPSPPRRAARRGSETGLSYEFNTVLEVEDMGFTVGKSSAEPSLKLHLLRFEMQPLYQDVKICNLAL